MNWTTRRWMRAAIVPAAGVLAGAYIHHLLKSKEILGMRLCVLHNIYFTILLLEKIRLALDEDCFDDFYRKNISILGQRI